MRYLEDLDNYARNLEDFIDFYDLPEEWFSVPDHIAVKCLDSRDYEDFLEQIDDDAEQISDITMHNRRLATVELLSGVALGSFGDVQVLEVMEPRPEKIGVGLVGFEHAEFYYPEFSGVRDILNSRQLAFEEPDDNDQHQCIVVAINGEGQEFKLNNRMLADIAKRQLETGESNLVK